MVTYYPRDNYYDTYARYSLGGVKGYTIGTSIYYVPMNSSISTFSTQTINDFGTLDVNDRNLTALDNVAWSSVVTETRNGSTSGAFWHRYTNNALKQRIIVLKNSSSYLGLRTLHNGNTGFVSVYTNITYGYPYLDIAGYNTFTQNTPSVSGSTITVSWINGGGLVSGDKHRIYYAAGSGLTASQIIAANIYIEVTDYAATTATISNLTNNTYSIMVVDVQAANGSFYEGAQSSIQTASITGPTPIDGQLSMNGVGRNTSSGFITANGMQHSTGSGQLIINGQKMILEKNAFVGVSNLNSIGSRILVLSNSYIGNSQFNVSAQKVSTTSLNMSGIGKTISIPNAIYSSSFDLSGIADISFSTINVNVILGQMNLQGIGQLSNNPQKILLGSNQFNGNGTILFNPIKELKSSFGFSGVSNITFDAKRIALDSWNGLGVSGLNTSGERLVNATLPLNGIGRLSSNPQKILVGSNQFNGNGIILFKPIKELISSINLLGISNSTFDAKRIVLDSWNGLGVSGLNTSGERVVNAFISLNSNGLFRVYAGEETIDVVNLKGIVDRYIYLMGNIEPTIYLVGNIEPTIYLVGNIEPTIYLAGNIDQVIYLRGILGDGSMTALNQNFSMFAGNTKDLVIPISDPNGKSIDLNGAELKWVLKSNLKAPNNLVEKTVGSGITITDTANGLINIHLDPKDTQNLSGNVYHAVRLTDGLGNESTVLTGLINLSKDGI